MSESLYTSHFLPGSGKRSASQKIGIIHAVRKVHGDNFSESLCGKKPKGKSLGWCETSNGIDCPKCIKAQTEG